MHYVYVITYRSSKLYIGYTANLKRRMKEHKAGLEGFIYYEAYKAKEDAAEREKQLKEYKSAWGYLKRRITKSRI